MPHFGHAIILAILGMMASVPTGVVITVRTISSRSGIGERAHLRVCGIDADEPSNVKVLLAVERTQAAPQSF